MAKVTGGGGPLCIPRAAGRTSKRKKPINDFHDRFCWKIGRKITRIDKNKTPVKSRLKGN